MSVLRNCREKFTFRTQIELELRGSLKPTLMSAEFLPCDFELSYSVISLNWLVTGYPLTGRFELYRENWDLL